MRAIAALMMGVLLLVGCGSPETPTASTTSAAPDDTGIDAQESKDPVTRLVLVEPGTGATVVFDAAEETETSLGEFGRTDGISGDGRFAYLRGADAITVVDGGSWTFDHGDHSHYYVEPAGLAGHLDGRFADAVGQRTLTVLRREDGTVDVLDRNALGEHRMTTVDGFGPLRDIAEIAPLGEDLVTVTRTGAISAVGPDGTAQPLGQCPDTTGASMVSGALIFGCADGAVRIAKRAGKLTADPMPFGNTRPATKLGRLSHRYGGSTLAAVTADEVWVLDGRRGAWASVRVPGAITANAVSGDSVLVLTADGQLRRFDTKTGTQAAAVPLFSGPVPSVEPTPVIEVDADRAYINDAAARVVYEVDYGDGLRLARTLKTSIAPGFMVETGR
ncbi:ABC transporter [Mycolicibacterium wolinskyi]|uniref:ABC transporter n=1 Tax=Mycolicibacterium wolinskyi TaxID=59750 RepID=A0A132PLX8_9MYCO|nr:ABC transporter [Mycolicibacterium wolinskyi]KWX23336.1 ABC transporter [Mycolicibacterium wolinskyi]